MTGPRLHPERARQDRLLDAIQPLYSQLTPEERSRNVQGDAYVYTRSEQNQGRYWELPAPAHTRALTHSPA